MTHQLRDALQASGILDQMAQEVKLSRPKYHQIFRLSLTKHEIKVALTVQCDRWEEGLNFICQRQLNSSDSPEELDLKLQNWSIEPAPDDGSGSLIYYRNYGKVK